MPSLDRLLATYVPRDRMRQQMARAEVRPTCENCVSPLMGSATKYRLFVQALVNPEMASFLRPPTPR